MSNTRKEKKKEKRLSFSDDVFEVVIRFALEPMFSRKWFRGKSGGHAGFGSGEKRERDYGKSFSAFEPYKPWSDPWTQCIPYAVLLEALALRNVRQLEDLVIEAVYADVLRGSLDQRNQRLEVDYSIGRDIQRQDLSAIARTLQEW